MLADRYVSILWPYLERNLRVNGGIVDEVLLITHQRDDEEGAAGARAILEAAVTKYPGVVVAVPFCRKPYGCAFNEILVDPNAVYTKIDDDIVFIKDGSFEHLVYQTLTNRDYTFFSGSVVNNPHSFGVHYFAGAYPPSTYHWKELGSETFQEHPPQPVGMYYGPGLHDGPGSQAHEAFIYNAARGRLDVYSFDLWNMHQVATTASLPDLTIVSFSEGRHGNRRVTTES